MNAAEYLDNTTLDLLLHMENNQAIYSYIKETQIDLLIRKTQGTYSREVAKHLFTNVIAQGYFSYQKNVGPIELTRKQSNDLALFMLYTSEDMLVTDYISEEDFVRLPMTFSVEVH